MRTLRLMAGMLVLCLAVDTTAQTPAFEAASVKRRTEPGGGFMGRRPGGRFVAEGVSLQDLIVFAYDIQPYQIIGGPPWLDRERWDVSATGGGGTPASVLVALQTLLGQRFALSVTRETRELPIYALMLDRPDGRLGPQLTRSTVDCAALQAETQKTGVVPPNAKTACRMEGRVGSITVGGMPLAAATPLFSTRLQRTVVDRTGLTGAWDFTLTYTPEPSQIAPGTFAPGQQPTFDPNGPSIFTAVRDQLGLKLESTRGPVPVLLIERAEFATPD